MRRLHLWFLLFFCVLAAPASAQQRWAFRTPMSTPRAGVAAAVLDGRIYVLGGEDRLGTVLDGAARYDLRTDAWEPLPPMRKARVNAAALAFDGRIYVLGGKDEQGDVLDDVEFFDPTSGRWESFDSMKEERQGLTAALRNQRIYVAGGSNDDEELLESIEFYDPLDGSWVVFDGENDDGDDEGTEVQVTGAIQALGAVSLTVEGLTFAVTDSTVIRDTADADILLSALSVGDVVEVHGLTFQDGTRIATRIRLEDGGDDVLGVLEACASNITLNTGDIFTIRDYIRVKDGSGPVDWTQAFFTYTEVGANDPTQPPDWNLDAFNAGQPVTVTAADAAAGTGNRGDGIYRVYVARQGQPLFDDYVTFRIDDEEDSEATSARCDANAGVAKRTESTVLGVPRASFAALTAGPDVLFVGGFSRFGPLDVVQRLRPDGTFDFINPLPEARGSLAAALVGDTVYVVGGRNAQDQVLGTVERLVLGGGGWQPAPPLNTAREGAAAVAVDGVVYVVGGRSPTGRVLDSVEAFGDLGTARDRPETPPDFRLAQTYPNPLQEAASIGFSVSARAAGVPVQLTIYDVRGRRVATLVDGPLPPGTHRVVWNGTTSDGVPLGSGAYIVRLRQGRYLAHHSLVILR